jgi:glycosyltransferase involved in cell wall biosynthesis
MDVKSVHASEVDQINASGLFDSEWYVEQYPDVRSLRISPTEHYCLIGWRLKRNPSEAFNTAHYLQSNPDVAQARINPLLHYVRVGRNQERLSEQATSRLVSIAKLPASSPPDRKSEHFKVYEAIKAEFDTAYYLLRYTDIARARIDPVRHYIEYGAREGRDPTPEFATKYYVQRYPDVAASGINPFYHYLTIGRAEGRGAISLSAGDTTFDAMCEIIGRPPSEVAQDLSNRRRDLRKRLEKGVLGQMVMRAGELEPLIHHSWPAAINARMPPFHSDVTTAQVVALHRLQTAAQWRRARAVIVIPHCRLSGSTRIAGHLATALSEIYGGEEIVVIRTDTSEMRFPDWFPDKCRSIDFSEIAKSLPVNEKLRVLVEFLRSLRPAAAFNVNSRLFWDLMLPFGQALSSGIALYAYMFCADKDGYGNWTGYPIKDFYRHFDVLSGVVTDSHSLGSDLLVRYQVPPAQTRKIATLETPIGWHSKPIQRRPRSGNERPQVYWAGRFDRQKRVDIVFAIADKMRDVEFHLWGEPVIDNDFRKLKKPDNVVLEGVYTHITDLPLERCDLWLYTSQWDGVPNILFEVAALHIPLVGSVAGGCGEVLIDGLCERVESVDDVRAFEGAIRRILANPVNARARAAKLGEIIINRRTPGAYRAAVKELLSRTNPA